MYIIVLLSSRLGKRKVGPPGVLGIWGDWLFIFRELGSTGNYLRGAREQANNFGDKGSLAKSKKKASNLFDFFFKISSVSRGLAPPPPPRPPCKF